MKFKSKKDKSKFFCLHPAIIMIFADLYNYTFEKHGVELVVTQTVSTPLMDKMLKRVSSAHRECRAIDVRTKDLDVYVLQDIMNYINDKEEYKQYHYVSKSGQKRLAYYHIGTAEHLHIAIHSKYKL